MTIAECRFNSFLRWLLALPLTVFGIFYIGFYISAHPHFEASQSANDTLYLVGTILITIAGLLVLIFYSILGEDNKVVNIICGILMLIGGLLYLIAGITDMKDISTQCDSTDSCTDLCVHLYYYLGVVLFVVLKAWILAIYLFNDSYTPFVKTIVVSICYFITAALMLTFWALLYKCSAEPPVKAIFAVLESGWLLIEGCSVFILVWMCVGGDNKGCQIFTAVLLSVGGALVCGGSIAFNVSGNGTMDGFGAASQLSFGITTFIGCVSMSIGFCKTIAFRKRGDSSEPESLMFEIINVV